MKAAPCAPKAASNAAKAAVIDAVIAPVENSTAGEEQQEEERSANVSIVAVVPGWLLKPFGSQVCYMSLESRRTYIATVFKIVFFRLS